MTCIAVNLNYFPCSRAVIYLRKVYHTSDISIHTLVGVLNRDTVVNWCCVCVCGAHLGMMGPRVPVLWPFESLLVWQGGESEGGGKERERGGRTAEQMKGTGTGIHGRRLKK